MHTASVRSTNTGAVTAAVAPTVNVRESACHIWCEEPFAAENAAIFKAVKAHLNRRGFALQADKELPASSVLKKFHRAGKSGDLEVVVKHSGRHIEVEFFQNVHNVDNTHGGRYDFDKLTRMPYLLRQRTRVELKQLADLATSIFGARLLPGDLGRPSPQGPTAMEFIEDRIRSSWHYKPELGHADWGCDANRRTEDKQLLTHGAAVYFRDGKGRWCKGTAYYNLNNMWWVAINRHEVTNKASFELSLTAPLNLRIKDNLRGSLQRVKALLEKAVALEDFFRAAKLKEVRTVLEIQAEQAAAAEALKLVTQLRSGHPA